MSYYNLIRSRRTKTNEIIRYILEDLHESLISGAPLLISYSWVNKRKLLTAKNHLKDDGIITPVSNPSNYSYNRKATLWKPTAKFQQYYNDYCACVDYKNLYEEWSKLPLPQSKFLKIPPATQLSFSSKYYKRVTIYSPEQAVKLIEKTYPWIKEYQQKVEFISEQLPALPKINFRVNVKTDDAYLQKTSIRWSNTAVNTKKDIRRDWLDSLGLTEEFDVHNSIYRVTYLLNNGIWLPQSEDLYKKMWEKTKLRDVVAFPTENDSPDESNESLLAKQGITDEVVANWKNGTFDSSKRDTIKKCVMRAYFDMSEACYIHHLRMAKYDSSDDKSIVQCEKAFVRGLYTDMRAVVGNTYDNEIFFHESCIYIDVAYKMTQMGVVVWNCFDGFYFTPGIVTPADVEQMIAEAAMNYYHNYFSTMPAPTDTLRACKPSQFAKSGKSITPEPTLPSTTQTAHTAHTDTTIYLFDNPLHPRSGINNATLSSTQLSNYKLGLFKMATLDEYNHHRNHYANNRQQKGIKHDSTNHYYKDTYAKWFAEHPECNTLDRATFKAEIAKYNLNAVKICRLWKWLNGK